MTTSTSGGNVCSDCHAATTWGTPGTAPAAGHINGTFAVGGTVSFTYTGVYPTVGTCGVNLCHNNGQSAAAVTAYTWGTAIGGGTNSCTECHNATTHTLVTNSHGPHLTTLDGRRGAVQRLPRGGDGGDARERVGELHGELHVHAGGGERGRGERRHVRDLRDQLCHNNGQSAAAILGVHLGHGDRQRDEQLHGVPQARPARRW